MNRNFDEPANGLGEAAARRRASRKLGIGLVGVALVCAGGMSAWADWTPPESSVTPPAVVTLDAFAARDVNGGSVSSALVAAPDGALYGSTPTGGTGGYGTLFKLETNGTFTKLHDFNGTDGNGPNAALVVGPDGALYGSTYEGGSNFGGPTNQGHGTLFRLETNGNFTKLHDFNGTDGNGPNVALVVGPGGALYGSTPAGGTWGYGTLFRIETSGLFTMLQDFNGTNGALPSAALVLGPDGALYGSTQSGGTGVHHIGNELHDGGTLFQLHADGSFTKLQDFNGSNGALPSAALVVGPDGALYGSTYEGGVRGAGTLFRLQTNGAFSKLLDFDFTNGGEPSTAMVVGRDGALYGSTQSGEGTLFRLRTDGTFTRLFYSSGFGRWPVAAMVVGSDGALYGSTRFGGPSNLGTLFRLQTNGTVTIVHNFNGTDGSDLLAALVMGPDGALYGSNYSGILFRLQTNGVFTKLYDFARTEADLPSAALVVRPDGAMYGPTSGGGTIGDGTLYRVTTNGNFTKLHDFSYSTDGRGPSVALVVGPDGALYGLNEYGGIGGPGYGTVYRMETNGVFTKLHDFNGTDGSYPAALVLGPDGALYGSTYTGGGTNGYGTLFRVDTIGNFTKLHDFNGTDGASPSLGLVAGPDGALYGSTLYGGASWYFGTLFRVATNGAFSKLHDFEDGYPLAPLVLAPDGALYGSTYNGGGTLFRVQTNGTFTTLHYFNGTDGSGPQAQLVVGSDGALYGSTSTGGTGGYGTLFRLETNGAFTKLHDFNGTDGSGLYVPLVIGPDGALYGSTYKGGTDDYGTLFQLVTNGIFAKLHDFNYTEGAYPSTALVLGPDGALYGSAGEGPRRGGILFKLLLNRVVARCHDVTVSAGANCVADASVDDGSFAIDASDTITLNQQPPGPYPLGTTPVTLTVTDNHGATASSTATVTVVDVTPPAISDVAATPNVLWPPNHKMVEVTVNYAATDTCGAVSNMLSVTSNEVSNGAPDWLIEDSHHVQLRAERSSTGVGRVYTINVISTDNAGNSSTRTVTVTAPRNQN